MPLSSQGFSAQRTISRRSGGLAVRTTLSFLAIRKSSRNRWRDEARCCTSLPLVGALHCTVQDERTAPKEAAAVHLRNSRRRRCMLILGITPILADEMRGFG